MRTVSVDFDTAFGISLATDVAADPGTFLKHQNAPTGIGQPPRHRTTPNARAGHHRKIFHNTHPHPCWQRPSEPTAGNHTLRVPRQSGNPLHPQKSRPAPEPLFAVRRTIGFFLSNALCYLLNRWFVFKPGRHHWAVELLLFFAASGFSMLVGSTVQTVLIGKFGFQTSVSFAANIVASLLINFVARKFFIFKG